MKTLATWMVGLLSIQYLLGLMAGMFEEIPADNPESVFFHVGYIHVHALTGLLLLILAIIFVMKAYKTKLQLLAGWSGLAAILIAAIAGQAFVHTQNDLWSIVMGIAWLAAFAHYFKALIQLKTK